MKYERVNEWYKADNFMGLFDYLKCEHPLPDGGEDLSFQTNFFTGGWKITLSRKTES